MTSLKLGTACLLVLMLCSCQPAYYATMEKFGVEKRDILVDRIEKTSDAQEDAQEQFRDALEQYRSVVSFDGGDLEKLYNKLNSEYQQSEQVAARIGDHIRSVETVADDLFAEWEKELKLIKNPSLRQDSATKLRHTRARSAELIAAMWRAEKTVYPVLDSLRDQVYYLKHNLNAQAIASLKGELRTIDADVSRLINQMQQAINQANEFIAQLK
ncbi:MAG: DUF2959 domain-containing protein [Porticoccaceae bacterium]|jgi:DNA-directed RNA polymerase subunit F